MPQVRVVKDHLGFVEGQVFTISEKDRAYEIVERAIAQGKAEVVRDTDKDKE